ncbi:amino acid ABC transporter substrate-binding protein [Candidatus Gottesmanbacteria bacterium]|nr:amino acid ABC transporter substrate-binding protein [Candidatus Gottesmanbacteria bacterium]
MESQSNGNSLLPVNPESAHGSKHSLRFTITTSLILIGMFVVLFAAGLYFSQYFFIQELEAEITENRGPQVIAIKQMGEMIIGTDPNYPPLSFINEENELVGYEVDLGSRISAEMGVEGEFITKPLSELYELLEKEEISFIVSGVTSSKDLSKAYEISTPYLRTGKVVLKRRDNIQVNSVSDLRGRKVLVSSHEFGETVDEIFSDSVEYTYEPGINAALKKLRSEEIDAVITDTMVARYTEKTDSSFTLAGSSFTHDSMVIVFKKGHTDLQREINSILTTLDEKGVLIELKKRWLQ